MYRILKDFFGAFLNFFLPRFQTFLLALFHTFFWCVSKLFSGAFPNFFKARFQTWWGGLVLLGLVALLAFFAIAIPVVATQ